MDKKNKIVLIICIIVIVVSLGAAVSIAVISNKKEKIDIGVEHKQVIKQQENEEIPKYDEKKDVNQMSDEELEKIFN